MNGKDSDGQVASFKFDCDIHATAPLIDVDQERVATQLEREILRVEDRYHELLAKIASRSVSVSEVMKEIALLRVEQAELRAHIDEVRRKLDPIYRSAFDDRIKTLGGLEVRAHLMSTKRARASSPDST